MINRFGQHNKREKGCCLTNRLTIIGHGFNVLCSAKGRYADANGDVVGIENGAKFGNVIDEASIKSGPRVIEQELVISASGSRLGKRYGQFQGAIFALIIERVRLSDCEAFIKVS